MGESTTDSDKTFNVNIYTPEKQFDSGEYISFLCHAIDGEICILKDHMPMIVAVDIGAIILTDDKGEKHTAVCGSGFAVIKDNVLNAFVETCNWKNSLQEAEDEAQLLREKEQESIKDLRRIKIELIRAMEEPKKKNN